MTTRTIRLGMPLAALAALALALSGCTGDAREPVAPTAPVVQLGAPGEEGRELDEQEQADIDAPAHTEVDVRFVKDMIHHHGQAVAMAGLVPDRTASDDVEVLAERMFVAQEQEVELMTTWLAERGESPDGAGHDHDHGALMPGMLTEDEMAALAAADGEEFDRLFLRSMTAHHEGALEMISDLYASGGGSETTLDELVRHMDSDQAIEITRMQEVLAGM